METYGRAAARSPQCPVWSGAKDVTANATATWVIGTGPVWTIRSDIGRRA